MSFKVMGIAAGRKNGNSEILLKEALDACREAGAEVTMINLKDYNILDCTGCTACTKAMSQGKHAGCVLDNKDDKKKIMDVMLAQDAVIFAVPTYDLMPASAYLTFAHRSLSYETSFLETIGAIEHRDRVAGLIEDGKWKFVIQKDGLLKDRTTVAGRAKHLEEIAQTQGGFFSDPEKIRLVQERKARYAAMQFKGID